MNNPPSVWEGNGWWDFSRGFYPEPFEILLMILFLCLFIGFLTATAIIQTRRDLKKRREADNSRYSRELDRYIFTPGEKQLLEEMLVHRPQDVKKADLLIRPEVFRYCEEAVLRHSSVPPMRLLASVRVKLGFTTYRPGREIRSTSEIPPGSKLHFENQNGVQFSGVIVRLRSVDFIVRISDGDLPAIGTPLDSSFTTHEGRYSFSTFVIFAEYPHVYFEHASITDHLQRRKYHRKELFSPVRVKFSGKNSGEVQTTLIEISGGGCSIVNSNRTLLQGMTVEVLLDPLRLLSTVGKIIRTSRNQSVAHVSFRIGREPDRDRLLKFISAAT